MGFDEPPDVGRQGWGSWDVANDFGSAALQDFVKGLGIPHIVIRQHIL